MPNWCENELRATGTEKAIKALQKYLSKGKNDLEFMFVLPPPNNEWDYNWCIGNWGTKWEPESVWSDWENDAVSFEMWTAWGPPVGIVQALATKFPKLKWELTYGETGMDFSGLMQWEKGQNILDVSGVYGVYYGSNEEEEEEEEESLD